MVLEQVPVLHVLDQEKGGNLAISRFPPYYIYSDVATCA